MRDAFERVLEAVRVVVERVDAPGVAGAVMMSVLDANQYELSALVNKLDEVTEDEVTPRASNRR